MNKTTDKEKLITAFEKFDKKGYASTMKLGSLFDINLLKDQKETDRAVYIFEDDLAAVLDENGQLKDDLVIHYEMDGEKRLSRTLTLIAVLKSAGLNCEPMAGSWDDSIIILAKQKPKGGKRGPYAKKTKTREIPQ